MDTHHNTRAVPGAQKGEQGPPSKAALHLDQPPSRDAVFLHANPSGTDTPTSSAPVSADLPGTGHDSGNDTGWYEVDGIRARVVILRAPDGGRLSQFIQNLLLDGDDGFAGAKVPVPVLPRSGDDAVAAAIPERELVLV